MISIFLNEMTAKLHLADKFQQIVPILNKCCDLSDMHVVDLHV